MIRSYYVSINALVNDSRTLVFVSHTNAAVKCDLCHEPAHPKAKQSFSCRSYAELAFISPIQWQIIRQQRVGCTVRHSSLRPIQKRAAFILTQHSIRCTPRAGKRKRTKERNRNREKEMHTKIKELFTSWSAANLSRNQTEGKNEAERVTQRLTGCCERVGITRQRDERGKQEELPEQLLTDMENGSTFTLNPRK